MRYEVKGEVKRDAKKLSGRGLAAKEDETILGTVALFFNKILVYVKIYFLSLSHSSYTNNEFVT